MIGGGIQRGSWIEQFELLGIWTLIQPEGFVDDLYLLVLEIEIEIDTLEFGQLVDKMEFEKLQADSLVLVFALD